jgi:acetyl esterase/lipase
MVTALAAFSAGTSTMPNSQSPYPIGIGGFEQWNGDRPFDAAGLGRVNVLIGVGALDENPADVARAWDDVGGTTRVERAARFTRALKDLGVSVRFQLYDKTGHAFIPAMRDDAVTLLRAS